MKIKLSIFSLFLILIVSSCEDCPKCQEPEKCITSIDKLTPEQLEELNECTYEVNRSIDVDYYNSPNQVILSNSSGPIITAEFAWDKEPEGFPENENQLIVNLVNVTVTVHDPSLGGVKNVEILYKDGGKTTEMHFELDQSANSTTTHLINHLIVGEHKMATVFDLNTCPDKFSFTEPLVNGSILKRPHP